MIKSYRGATVLVTGASSGIGKSFARELAGQGADLILVSRGRAKLEQLAEDLKRRHGIRAWVFDGDLTLGETRERLFQFTRANSITVDILINNAGFGHYGAVPDHSIEDISAMIRLNVEALAALTRMFLPGMQERRKGGILNVASTAAFQPMPYLSVYAATKAFVLSFSEALWMECLKYDVRVFCLCPGNTLTQFHQTAGIRKQRMFLSASAPDVVRFALRKFIKGKRPTGIFGLGNKMMIYAERLGPRALIAFFTSLIYRPSQRRTTHD
jgi:short-subunit dehydrogenase